MAVLCIDGYLADNASDIAEEKGYEKRKWFNMCFWLGLPSYLILIAMPDRKLHEAAARMIKLQQEQITETHGRHAQACMSAGDYEQAYKPLEAIAHNAVFTVGNYVTLGTYPQTAEGTDETPIEWLVLARDGEKALLLSRCSLDAQPYNTENTSVTWETCTLRRWLNNDFINRAFTVKEQSAILLTYVDNSSSQGYSGWETSGGNDTQDKVFLLSYAEANQYLGVTYVDDSNTKARVAPTAYVLAQGAYASSDYKTEEGVAAGWWWLRSPGYDQSNAARVSSDGSLSFDYVFHDNGSVRPACG